MINSFTIDVIGIGKDFQARISIVKKETYSIVVIRNLNNTENNQLIRQLKSLILRDFKLTGKIIPAVNFSLIRGEDLVRLVSVTILRIINNYDSSLHDWGGGRDHSLKGDRLGRGKESLLAFHNGRII